MEDSLKQKTVRGVGWSFIDNIASSGITFLVGLVLARLLTPEEYGVMAIIAIFIAISNSIIDSGFSNALIRKIKVERVDYNTVFYFNLLVSIILYIFLFFSAPVISAFFKEPENGEALEDKSKEMLKMYDYQKIAAQYMELFRECL